ncbi:FAD-dependent oxidoreductase [Sphingomonas sp. MG17]|uniref:FAD-dependent oxidoreductase n=1 Tax=Sphingomonas tagetis TaxID=2949092 RepID=A0A9X2HHU9_9SPHN|nr:FAD-dependent oxidoreductase [Sphingomonas tagetis]MCP3731108.1 FAD-dependent oxidoreductase [Sphingomonas tagetis]
MLSNETFVLIGGGYASSRTADCLRQEGFDGRIVLVSEEPHLPYSRPPLCKKGLVSQLDITRLPLRHAAFYERSRIELMLGKHVTGIDRAARRVRIEGEASLDYDKLLIGTGGRPRRLPIPGNELAGIHVIRTYEDMVAMRAGFAPGARLAIIGAGYIGLETAASAVGAGLDVTVIELSARLMSRVAAPVTSEFFARYHLDHGVKLMLHRSAQGFEGVDGRVAAVLLDDGTRVAADLVLVAAGNIPEFSLAAEAGLTCEGGIVVDDRCRTSDPLIFAAGDCTRHPSVRYGRRIQLESVDNALEQARVAAAGMCGRKVRHAHVPWFWSDQYNLKLQIVGLADGFDEIVVRGDPDKPGYSIWYLRESEVLCMETVNNPREFMQAGRWIGAHAKVDARILRDAGHELDEAVIGKNELLEPVARG